MQINFERTFLKDINKLNNPKIAKKLKLIINQLEISQDIRGLQNIKKLTRHNNFFRIKLGDYRLGFSYIDNQINIIRFLHRKDIYKLFP